MAWTRACKASDYKCRIPWDQKKHIFWLSSPEILIEASLLLSSIKNCCPLNRDPFQSSCYFFFMNTMTWTLSLNNCSGMGAHLVIINTQEEQVSGVQVSLVLASCSSHGPVLSHTFALFDAHPQFVKWMNWNSYYYFCKSLLILSLLLGNLTKKAISMWSSIIS